MNRFFAFFVISLLVHAVVGAVLVSRSGLLGGQGKEEAVEVNPLEENEEPEVEPVEKPVVKKKKIKKPPKPKTKPKKEKKPLSPKTETKPPEEKKEEVKPPPVKTPPPVEAADKKPEVQEEESQDESELIEPEEEKTPPAETKEPLKEEDESELIEPEKETLKPEEKAPAPSGSELKKPSALEVKQARSHSQLKQIKGNPLPVYPAEALKQKWEGRVEVIYYVNPGGFVEQIQLKKSSGHSALDNSALRALSRYRYHPGQEGWVQHPVEFFLEKGKEIKEVAPLGVPESE